MANPNVFAQFAQPVRSVADYSNDLENSEALRNKNALQALTVQQQTAATNQGLQERNALQRIAATSGGDRTALIAGLRNSGLPGLMAQADTLEKSGADLVTSQSVAGKNKAETDKINQGVNFEKRDKALTDIAALDSPESAIASLNAHHAAGDIDDLKYQTVLSTLAPALRDPTQFSKWQVGMLKGILTPQQNLELTKPVLGTTNTGGATAYTSRDPMTGAVTQNGSVAMTATPGEVLSNNMAGARLTEEKRHNGATEGLESTKVANTSAATPKLNEGQGKATTFAARMADAESTIQAMEAKGVSGSDLRTIAAGNGYTNFLASPDGQDYRQAQENWVTANLRQESGAAIGKDEMAKDVRKFFPAPGDGDSVKAQKARARSVAQQGMLVQAGPGAAQVPGILQKAGGQSAPAADAGVPADIAAILAKHGGK